MKLTIFGASGRTGVQLTEQALAAGHDVVALMRNPAKLELRHERLHVTQGELTDAAAVDGAVSGADAVLATLSPKMIGGPADLPVARGTENILASMTAHGVRRLVYSWGPSIVIPESPRVRAVRSGSFAVLGLIPAMRPLLSETARVGEAIRGSDRDWTMVIVTAPHDKPASGQVRARTTTGTGEKVGARISRVDLAKFMLDQVNDTQFFGKEVRVSN